MREKYIWKFILFLLFVTNENNKQETTLTSNTYVIIIVSCSMRVYLGRCKP